MPLCLVLAPTFRPFTERCSSPCFARVVLDRASPIVVHVRLGSGSLARAAVIHHDAALRHGTNVFQSSRI